ncbi:MAG TPA: PqqD family protein [Solirubrobacteraceae bacterium]|nr:PqqD family protein [Solirubrobacteraceae bacterium]
MARCPNARRQGLLTESVDGELIIYDQASDLVCRLNRTAACVWKASDGTRTVGDLVDVLAQDLGDVADEDLVLVTLDSLSEYGLLEAGYPQRDEASSQLSRRRFIRSAGVVGVAAAALPMVSSLVAPTPAAAFSVIVY